MYVITADVKYSDNTDYVKSFLSYDEYTDWGWVNGNEFMTIVAFPTLEEAEAKELAIINGDIPVNEYYAGVKNVAIQGIALFDIS